MHIKLSLFTNDIFVNGSLGVISFRAARSRTLGVGGWEAFDGRLNVQLISFRCGGEGGGVGRWEETRPDVLRAPSVLGEEVRCHRRRTTGERFL